MQFVRIYTKLTARGKFDNLKGENEMSNLPNIDKIMHMNMDTRVAFLEALSDEQVIALRDAANMAAGVSNDKHFDIHELDIRHIRNQQAFEMLFNLCCRRLWAQGEFQC